MFGFVIKRRPSPLMRDKWVMRDPSMRATLHKKTYNKMNSYNMVQAMRWYGHVDPVGLADISPKTFAIGIKPSKIST